MNYLITVSWQDKHNPMIRHKEMVTEEFENISEYNEWGILGKIRKSNHSEEWAQSEVDFVIDFMMKLED